MSEHSGSSPQTLFQPQCQQHLHHYDYEYNHTKSPERRGSRHHSQSHDLQYHHSRRPSSSAAAANRLSYPPRALIRPDHSSHRSHHSSGRNSQQHDRYPRSPSDHSQYQGHAQHQHRHSSADSNLKDETAAQHYRIHDSRRSTQATVERLGSHDVQHQHHIISTPRSQERLYNPDDDDEDEDELSPAALLRAMLLLSAPVPLLSLVLCIYSFMMIVLATFVSPLRLCIRSMNPLRVRVQNFLLPPLNMQRRLMKLDQVQLLKRSLPLAPGTTSLKVDQSAYLPCKTSAISWMHILSPLVAAILAFAAWITSFVWLWSGMLNHESIADVSRGERRMARRIFNVWLCYLDWPLREGLDTEDWQDEEKRIALPRTPEILEVKAPRPSV